MKNKINILHTTLFLGMGGLESIIMDLAKCMDKNQFNIFVLCLSGYDETYKKTLEKIGVKVFFVERKGRFDFSFFKSIISLLKKNKIDVVHTHSGCLFNSSISAFFARTPFVVYTEHGLQLYNDGTPINDSLKTKIENNIAGLICDRMFAVSKEIKADMEYRFKFQRSKIKMVSNGIDTKLFIPGSQSTALKRIKQGQLSSDTYIIGSVGRLVHIKNYSCLIRAFAKLPSHILENAQLVFIGDGDKKETLKIEAEKLNVEDKIVFLGVRYDISELLPAFDVFVLSSFTEGTSISLLEAQSCGIPAVATRVGGNIDIIDNFVNGLLCKSDDSKDLADKISLILADKKIANKMSVHARKKVVEQYSLQNMVNQYTATYQMLSKDESK